MDHRLAGVRAFILSYIRAHSFMFGILFAGVLAAASCAVAVQYVMKLMVDAMAGTSNTPSVWAALSFFLVLIASESILWRVVGWLGCRTTVAVGVDVRLDLFDYLNGQPMRYFAENLAGSLGQRITMTAGNMGALINTIVWRILPPCIDFFGALILFSTVSLAMMVVLAVMVVAITTGLILFGERGRPLHRRYAERANRVGGDLVDVISNMWAVKAFSARQREWDRLAREFDQEADAQRSSWMYTEKARLLHDVALWIMAGTMLSWAVWLWSTQQITPGDVVLVSALTFRILHGSRDIALSLVDTVQHAGFIEETLKVIGQAQTVVDEPDAPPLIPRGGSIEFRNVCFGYGEGSDAIHDLNLFIPSGQKVGIVGPSGAGKSTCIHLIQRLYDVHKGEILIDRQPVTKVNQDSLRACLAVVPQEITLLHRTVLENIRLAWPDASDENVLKAAKAAHCHGFIMRLPMGYDTIVGERGSKLSGGQRQRIGIARAFLKKSEIIIFDEATSALDTESEMQIQNALVHGMRNRTVVAVAHRLSTLIHFDRILVIKDGVIAEDGTAAELRARRGVFDKMWRLQAEGSDHPTSRIE
ncbi:ATP-binding cassette subfamily B protein [Rhodoligotrophos appendicifer]|uniref:ABC transporter ATP-binding protein n=1 Tax=Rhodoligotrophos appendicifer TaxID=987056 RepID=UPI0011870BBE|nr:ABC transporter ATP-binding protein [Rhodoligotrophos appendicifer]